MKLNDIKNKFNLSIYIILLSILIIGFVLRYPLVHYNAPICANFDERAGLDILINFEKNGLNPNWFQYPTFYFYLTFFFLKSLAVKEFLLYGRILNLLFGCALAISVLFLSKQFFGSSISSLIASTFVMLSPIIIMNGAYITTDVLLDTLSMLALLFFAKFFESYDYKYWLLGILVTGLAISTKYTAVIIAVSYVIMEFIYYKQPPVKVTKSNMILKFINIQIRPNLMVFFLIIFAIVIFTISLFFLTDFVLSILKAGARINSVIDSKDIQYIQSLKMGLLYLGIIVLLIGFVFYRFKKFSKRFSNFRPYIAVLLIALVYLLGSPYTLISWKTFLYDFGSELKANALSSGGQQWFQYFNKYFYWESFVILFFFLVGLLWAVKLRRDISLLGIYMLLSYFVIGSATRGFPRYLTPILLIVFIISAFGIYYTGVFLGRFGILIKYFFIFLVVVLIGLELNPKVSSVISKAKNKNEMYHSYVFVNKLKPNKIYYSGSVPHVEFIMNNFIVKEIPIKTDIRFLKEIKPKEILIVDKKRRQLMNCLIFQNLRLLYSSDKGYGQYIYKRSIKK